MRRCVRRARGCRRRAVPSCCGCWARGARWWCAARRGAASRRRCRSTPRGDVRRRRGDEANIVVTQPRRIAAISLAERVAAERGGGVVGCAVRLESRSAETRLLFCATGVLLRQLQGAKRGASLPSSSMRCTSDRSTRSADRAARGVRLAQACGSATLDAERFASYFAGGGGKGAAARAAAGRRQGRRQRRRQGRRRQRRRRRQGRRRRRWLPSAEHPRANLPDHRLLS